MAAFDLTRMPVGVRGWDDFIQYVGQVDDRAERYFLELKSTADLNSDGDRAKVAKFVLGAANRDPDRAGKRFDGRALMVLGVSKGSITGIGTFESKDLEQFVTRFIGDPGPVWDHHSVPVDADHEVIVIIVDPPDPSRHPWPSMSEGHGLTNGTIYHRVDGATHPAKGREVLQMLERTRKAQASTVELAVDVVGKVRKFTVDEEVLDKYLEHVRANLIDAFPKPEPEPEPDPEESSPYGLAGTVTKGIFGKLMDDPAFKQIMQPQSLVPAMFEDVEDDRSYEAYAKQIANWQAHCRAKWPEILDKFAGVVFTANEVRVRNLSKSNLEDVEVKIHFEGHVYAIDKDDSTHFTFSKEVPRAPRKWGPQRRDLYGPLMGTHFPIDRYIPHVTPSSHGVVRFNNGGSIDLDFELDRLRPLATDYTEASFILFVEARHHSDVESIHATWTATDKTHDEVYEGSFDIPVSEQVIDLTPRVRGLLGKNTTYEQPKPIEG